MAATVLVVEDEQKLRELVRSYLERAGFALLSTGSGAEAITMAADALAKAAEEERIAGLELGADDYVTKPFSPRELVLRVQAVLRCDGPAAARGVTSYGGGCWSLTSRGAR